MGVFSTNVRLIKRVWICCKQTNEQRRITPYDLKQNKLNYLNSELSNLDWTKYITYIFNWILMFKLFICLI